jgi:hypothetical protein
MSNLFRNFHSLSKNLNNKYVFNILGPSENTLEAIYNISFILYGSVPYSMTTNVKSYYNDVFVPSYYKDLKEHIYLSDSKVILNKCDIIQCKEMINIQNYVDTISLGKWRTHNIFVVPSKEYVETGCEQLDISMCDNCVKCLQPKTFLLSNKIEDKILFVNKLLLS